MRSFRVPASTRAVHSVLTAASVLATVVVLAAPENADSGREAREACRALVLDYAYTRDHGDPDGYANVFASDGVFTFRGSRFEGRDAIRQRMRDEMGRATRHIMSNIQVRPIDAVSATVTSYVTVVAGPTGAAPIAVERPMGVGEYRDLCRKTAEGWRIQRREFTDVFAFTD